MGERHENWEFLAVIRYNLLKSKVKGFTSRWEKIRERIGKKYGVNIFIHTRVSYPEFKLNYESRNKMIQNKSALVEVPDGISSFL